MPGSVRAAVSAAPVLVILSESVRKRFKQSGVEVRVNLSTVCTLLWILRADSIVLVLDFKRCLERLDAAEKGSVTRGPSIGGLPVCLART